jgi:chromosome partitioning protein
MRTTAIVNLKGGVGKTTTAINLAYQLYLMEKSVLLIDLDKQGNVSKFFKIHSYERPSVADVLLGRETIEDSARSLYGDKTSCGREDGFLDVLPANMSLLIADRQILIDTTKPQQTRLKKALSEADGAVGYYDYCIIDCAPDINISVINALVAADDIVIPVTIDQFAYDGINEIKAQIDDVRDNFNPNLEIGGCLVTSYRDNDFNRDGVEYLKAVMGGYVYESKIKWSGLVNGSTFEHQPLDVYSPRCAAAKGYREFAAEYVKGE